MGIFGFLVPFYKINARVVFSSDSKMDPLNLYPDGGIWIMGEYDLCVNLIMQEYICIKLFFHICAEFNLIKKYATAMRGDTSLDIFPLL